MIALIRSCAHIPFDIGKRFTPVDRLKLRRSSPRWQQAHPPPLKPVSIIPHDSLHHLFLSLSSRPSSPRCSPNKLLPVMTAVDVASSHHPHAPAAPASSRHPLTPALLRRVAAIHPPRATPAIGRPSISAVVRQPSLRRGIGRFKRRRPCYNDDEREWQPVARDGSDLG